MLRHGKLWLLPLSMAVFAVANQPWMDKQVAEWTDDDTREVLNDSPWAKTVTPTIDRSAENTPHRGGPGMGRGVGIGIGGIGIGLPGGGGMGRRGGYPGGRPDPAGGETSESDRTAPPALKLRWESALPIREAELKARETNAPTVDEDHYAIAVYGVPRRLADGNPAELAKQLRKLTVIKRVGKKDFKPSGVDVLPREDATVIVYLFPRSQEITRHDKRVEFDAQIGKLRLAQSFSVDDMIYRGKLEL